MAYMEIIIATAFVASLSLSGVIFWGATGHIVGAHRFIVPFGIGAFLAVTFFELIPETLEASEWGSFAVVGGFLLFYLLSNVLHTYHHHHNIDAVSDHCGATKVSALMLLWGDAVHNFTDGIVIASAFLINPAVGIATTIGIAFHEIPQEIAEYGVLRKAGYTAKKAVLLNGVSSFTVVFGAGVALLFLSFFTEYLWVLTGIAAGNLLYVSTLDLLPGVHRESQVSGSFLPPFIATICGVIVVGTLVVWTQTIY